MSGFYTSDIRLELTDAQTGKVQQVVTHNFAALQTVANGAWQQRNVFKTGLSAIGTPDTDYQPHWAANAMVLSDSTAAEDPENETYMQGQTIGYALKATYAGSDIWRGTVATTQLEATPEHVKWVFDWPTHAANGTIGSVGWVDSQNQVASDTTPQFRSTMSHVNSYTTAGNFTNFTRANGSLSFGGTGNTTIYVLDAAYAQTTTFNVSSQFTAVRGIAWDSVNEFLWVIGDSSTTRRIAAYNAAGVLQTGPFTTTTRSYIRLAHDGTHLWSVTQDSGSSHTAWRISTADGSDVSNFTFTTNPSAVVCGLAWDAQKDLLWTRFSGTTGIQAWDTSGNRKSVEISTNIYTPSAGNYSTNLSSAYDFDITNGNELFLAQASSTIRHCKLDGLGTRALLPTPVLKNNTQTLKLIYTINYI